MTYLIYFKLYISLSIITTLFSFKYNYDKVFKSHYINSKVHHDKFKEKHILAKVSKQLVEDFEEDSIEFVTLGSSDLNVSRICMGTMTYGQQNTQDESFELLNIGISKYGINFLDTAEIYPVPTKPNTQGETDRIIGNWMKKEKIDRSKLVIASKVAGYSSQMTYLPGRPNGARVDKNSIKISVDESLKRLQTEYIDLLQIHWPDRYAPIFGSSFYDTKLVRENPISFEEQLLAMEELIKEGKVRYIGLSNETPYGVMKFTQVARDLGISSKIISLQNCYSLVCRSDYESSMLEVCAPHHENISLLAYSPLAGGILTGKYESETCPTTSRFNLFPGYMERYKQSVLLKAVKEYMDLGKKLDMTLTELALGWCYSRPYVASTIIGATTIRQLEENIQAWTRRFEFTEDVDLEVNKIMKLYRDPSKL